MNSPFSSLANPPLTANTGLTPGSGPSSSLPANPLPPTGISSQSPFPIDLPSPLAALLQSSNPNINLNPNLNPTFNYNHNQLGNGNTALPNQLVGGLPNQMTSSAGRAQPLFPPAGSTSTPTSTRPITTNQPNNSVSGPDSNPNLDDILRAMVNASAIVERAEVLFAEIIRLEEGVFDGGEGVVVGMGGMTRLELLQLEYTQTLQTLIRLSTTHLFGSLPLPLSSASASSAPALTANTDISASANADTNSGTGTGTSISSTHQPTIPDLITWCEARSALEFGRKEAVRASGRGVLEVLAGSGAAAGGGGGSSARR